MDYYLSLNFVVNFIFTLLKCHHIPITFRKPATQMLTSLSTAGPRKVARVPVVERCRRLPVPLQKKEQKWLMLLDLISS